MARILSVCLFVLVALGGPALAEKRLALVIGNDAYLNLPPDQQLQKARNDATAMAGALRGLGFETLLGLDLGRSEMNLKIQQFANRVERGDTVAVFFAGHGVRVGGANYLLPSDVPKIKSGQEAFLKAESVRVDSITDTINAKGAKITLLILDACRDNPFKDSTGRSVGGTRGLARMTPVRGTFIMFSAGAGQQALDRLSDSDTDPNSVFTRTLLPLLKQPGLEIAEMAKLVKRSVYKLALTAGGHEQTPAVYNEMLADFYLGGSGTKPPRPAVVTTAPITAPAAPSAETRSDGSKSDTEILFWQSVTANPTKQSYEAYLESYPTGTFAPLARARIAALSEPSPQPEPVPQANDTAADYSGFIFPDSHQRRLTLRELARLSKRDLRIARNEIFARNGRHFKSRDLQIHFGRYPWYRPYTWKPSLTPLEKLNVQTILSVERRKKR